MEGAEGFVDRLYGELPASTGDDFIVRRSDGLYAYQLAVVVDDIAMGITEVVRGADLLQSTAWQIALYRALEAPPPAFLHVPLVLGPDGKRLAKRNGSTAMTEYRRRGTAPERLVGILAASLGLIEQDRCMRPADLVEHFDIARLSTQSTVFDAAIVPGSTGVSK
jgi:glutamyl-tRNA synthetase